jgi:hypothetical protein
MNLQYVTIKQKCVLRIKAHYKRNHSIVFLQNGEFKRSTKKLRAYGLELIANPSLQLS